VKRVAIVGGGIAGLAAAYELEQQRLAGAAIDWQLYEASARLGGIVSTTRGPIEHAGFILEEGPDAWVTDKPWAKDLAIELGLESEIIVCNESQKKTYVLIGSDLQAMPPRMRMMVPEDLSVLADSPLFSENAREAYAEELNRAYLLRATAPTEDESVASFVLRHFGQEVLDKIGAPLLSGVFGGDVEKLSVRSVMPAFVKMEQEHGSLIAALQARARERGDRAPQPTFTTLRRGMGSLAEAIVAKLPKDRLHLRKPVRSMIGGAGGCMLDVDGVAFQHVMLAAPVDAAKRLLQPVDPQAATLVPNHASSAVLAAFAWPAEQAKKFTIPEGFGFLVPQSKSVISTEAQRSGETPVFGTTSGAQLLACTFVDQKFPHRAPAGAKVLRAFFGGQAADSLSSQSDEAIAAIAFLQLSRILGPLPAPDAALTTVRRWPRSLPQYEVGHLERMATLDARITKLGGLSLLGNGYRGVGVPDLIKNARETVRSIVF
jgi:oxygen-dependent protoporphyrinogen oxidase